MEVLNEGEIRTDEPTALDDAVCLVCHHRHRSRVFTINEQTYKVCLDCGHEFRLPDASLGTSIDEDVRMHLKPPMV